MQAENNDFILVRTELVRVTAILATRKVMRLVNDKKKIPASDRYHLCGLAPTGKNW